MRRAFIILILAVFIGEVHSQNLALTAIPSASASSSGSYGPSNWNDGFIGPMYYFGWVGTEITFPQPPWIQYEWTSPQTFNTIVLHPPTWSNPGYVYFYGSAEIHFWDGTAWVNHHSFASGLPGFIDTVNFQQITSTRVRITNFSIIGQHNPGWDEIEVFDQQVVATNPDVGVCAILAPLDTVVANSALDVEIMICNHGTETVFEIPVTYMPVGGVASVTDTISIPAGFNPSDTIYHIFSLPLMVPVGSTELCVYTELYGDINPANDTLCVQLYAPDSPPTGVVIISNRNEPLRVYPVPAKDHLIIQSMDQSSSATYRIADMLGQVILSGNIPDGSMQYQIDLSSLNTGFYLISVDFGKSGYTRKIQVIR